MKDVTLQVSVNSSCVETKACTLLNVDFVVKTEHGIVAVSEKVSHLDERITVLDFVAGGVAYHKSIRAHLGKEQLCAACQEFAAVSMGALSNGNG